METSQIIIIALLVVVLVALGGFVYYSVFISNAAGDQGGLWSGVGARPGEGLDTKTLREMDAEAVKKYTGRAKAKKAEGEDLGRKLFRAGLFTEADKLRFQRLRIISSIVGLIAMPIGIYWITANPLLTLCALILGGFIGWSFPITRLERAINERKEETLRFLPLAIEQVAIGVSSALDIGPCLSHITHMATLRDSHNPVTEMFVHVEKLIKSGLSLDDALMEVAEVNGISDIKHAFMFLAQCAKHGGEISKQLQELADAVMVQRQNAIEAKITALPVKATGPLAMVFAGFFAMLFAGLMVRLMGAFGG